MNLPDRRDLLWSGGLLALGIGGYFALGLTSVTIATRLPQAIVLPLLTIGWLCILAAVGAGLGALFKRKFMGALVGLTVGLTVLILVHLPQSWH